jgi:hypothetical protein
MQRAQARTRLPSILAYCKFGNSLLMLARIEWLRLIVFEYPFPQISHILGISVILILSILTGIGIMGKYDWKLYFIADCFVNSAVILGHFA